MKEFPLIIVALAILAGCAGPKAVSQMPGDAEPTTRAFVYDCGAERFRVEVGGGVSRVQGPGGRELTLQPARSATGARYEGENAVYWSKGELAGFQWDGRRYEDCRENPRATLWADAASRGVDFRALGSEPGWLLEVRDGGHLTFVADYGARRVLAPDPGAQRRGGARVYEAVTAEHRLQVVIRRQPCRDPMSGEPFEARVEVRLDDTAYRGCGSWLPWSPEPGSY